MSQVNQVRGIWNQATVKERRRFLVLAKIPYPGAARARFDSLGAWHQGKLIKALNQKGSK